MRPRLARPVSSLPFFGGRGGGSVEGNNGMGEYFFILFIGQCTDQMKSCICLFTKIQRMQQLRTNHHKKATEYCHLQVAKTGRQGRHGGWGRGWRVR